MCIQVSAWPHTLEKLSGAPGFGHVRPHMDANDPGDSRNDSWESVLCSKHPSSHPRQRSGAMVAGAAATEPL